QSKGFRSLAQETGKTKEVRRLFQFLVGVFSSRQDPWNCNCDFRGLCSLVKTIVEDNLLNGRYYLRLFQFRLTRFPISPRNSACHTPGLPSILRNKSFKNSINSRSMPGLTGL